MQSINPATGEVIGEYPEHSAEEVQNLVQMTADRYVTWRETSFEERTEKVLELAAQIRKASAECARTISEEMGKPIKQAEAEIEKCAVGCEYYAREAEKQLAPDMRETDASKSYVRYDPIGPVLAIMPWNFPFWQVFRFAAPAVMAGNVGLLKHANSVSGCAVAIERLFREAGFPPNVFTTLLIEVDGVKAVIDHPEVRAVTLTGSERAGMAVAQQAGAQLKKCVLELGGSDAFIVLADADIAKTAEKAAWARLQNAGQSCIAAKRFLVEDSIADEFQAAMVKEMEKIKMGDPLDPETKMGPLARADLRDSLHEQVEKSVAKGAKIVTGGEIPDGKGAYYPATLLSNVKPGMAAFDEEMFGPVAAVVRVKDADEAIELANQSQYGLGGSIWTSDTQRAEKLAARIDTGGVFINEMTKSDPRVPFGGVKCSGYGRELAEFGIREFVNIKTVWVA